MASPYPQLQALVGCWVSRVSLGDDVRLLLWQREPARIDAELALTARLVVRDGTAYSTVDPDTGQNLAACLALLHKTVSAVEVTHRLQVRLTFAEDLSVVTLEERPYDSWSIKGLADD